MSTQQTSLNAIAIDVVGHYGQAAKHLVAAYRDGTRRAVTGLSGRYQQLLEGRPLQSISPEVKARIIDSEQRVAGFVVDAVQRVSERVDGAVDVLSSRAVEGMEVFGKKTAWANDSLIVNAVRTANMPAALVSLTIANQLANASRRLSERAAGTAVQEDAPAPAAAKRTRRAGTRKA